MVKGDFKEESFIVEKEEVDYVQYLNKEEILKLVEQGLVRKTNLDAIKDMIGLE